MKYFEDRQIKTGGNGWDIPTWDT